MDWDLLNAARMILEGKKPEKKDKKDDDIEIDVKTKDGKVTKLHTKDGDGDGKVADKGISTPKDKDKQSDSKSGDNDSGDKAPPKQKSDNQDDSSDDSKPKKKSDSPVKDDSNQDGAEEKEVPEDSADSSEEDDDEDSKDDSSKESDDELDKSKDGEGSDQKSDSEKEDEVDGSDKTKINLKPKIKDEEPGEMPVSEKTIALFNELEHLKQVAEKYEGAYVGQCAEAMYRARAKAISSLEIQVHESLMNDIAVYLDQGFSVFSEEYGEGECIPGEFFVFENFRVEAAVMFEHGVEKVNVDINEISKELAARYAKRATGELTAHSFFDGAYTMKNNPSSEDQKHNRFSRIKSKNRERGVKRAIDRLTKEDVEVNEKHIGFKKLEKKLSHEKGVYNPAGLAAAIGRKKYGAKKFKQMSEGFAQQGTNALQSAKHHEAMQAHHEELAANHENQENYGLAKNHDMAAHLHSQAADSYRNAASAFRKGSDDAGASYLDRAQRHATYAENHENENGIHPTSSQ